MRNAKTVTSAFSGTESKSAMNAVFVWNAAVKQQKNMAVTAVNTVSPTPISKDISVKTATPVSMK